MEELLTVAGAPACQVLALVLYQAGGFVKLSLEEALLLEDKTLARGLCHTWEIQDEASVLGHQS